MVELPEPEASHMLTPGEGVLVEVHAAGVSFPELLQTRGAVPDETAAARTCPAARWAGVVISAPDGRGGEARRSRRGLLRARRLGRDGGGARVLHVPAPPDLDFAQGAALVLNYHTAYFCLKCAGGSQEGETVLVHGAAGGVGTASLQVAKGARRDARSRPSRARRRSKVAEEAGADHVVMIGDGWKDEVVEISRRRRRHGARPGRAATASSTACARCARTAGCVVVGFTGGSIPEVQVNRLLLKNTEVIGAGWGAYVMGKPDAQPSRSARLSAR